VKTKSELERQVSCTVQGLSTESIPVLAYLARRFTYHNAGKWQQEISIGRILVNGRRISGSEMLRSGDLIEYLCHDLPEPEADCSYKIIFQDKDLLIVDKPASLPCHPHGRYFKNTLWYVLKKELGNPSFSFVNRIDRETSGLILLATNRLSADNCQKQFKEKKVYKRYLALVWGCFPMQLTAKGYLAADTLSSIRHKNRFIDQKSDQAPESAKKVHTHFQLLKKFDEFSLIEAIPFTGRRHQIRATLAALNHHVVGDKIYNRDDTLFARFAGGRLTEEDHRKLGHLRQALHAADLSFDHPRSGRRMHFTSPLPPDLLKLLP
jgi:RluA family pseudouridine synthase